MRVPQDGGRCGVWVVLGADLETLNFKSETPMEAAGRQRPESGGGIPSLDEKRWEFGDEAGCLSGLFGFSEDVGAVGLVS